MISAKKQLTIQMDCKLKINIRKQKKERNKIMEKTIVKRTGEFIRIIEQSNKRFAYDRIMVNCEIYNKKAEMIFQDSYNHENVGIHSWRFITGDEVVDSQTKVHENFEMFKMLDIEVDNMGIIAEAKQFFIELEEKARLSRAKYYDDNLFLKQLAPAIEAKGYKVSPTMTRDEYINKSYGDIELLVETDDSEFIVGHEYHGWVRAIGTKNVDDGKRVEKTTKSKKIDKMVETLEDAIKQEQNLIKLAKEKTTKLQNVKQILEDALGIEVELKKEWHTGYGSFRKASQGYYTEHFIDKKYSDNGYYSCLRFTESTKTVNGKRVRGFTISHLPTITDMKKLKQIYDLLTEE